jgi:hypothetical protein
MSDEPREVLLALVRREFGVQIARVRRLKQDREAPPELLVEAQRHLRRLAKSERWLERIPEGWP